MTTKIKQQVDHLIEQVDGQHTLYGVPLDVAKTTDSEVTHGHSGEANRVSPVTPIDQTLKNIDAIEMEVCTQHRVHDEQLSHGIGNEQALDQQVTQG